MGADIIQITAKFIEKRRQGLDYTLMRKELENEGISDEAIRLILRKVDENERYTIISSSKINDKDKKKYIRLISTIICASLLTGMVLFLGRLPVFPAILIVIVWGRIFFIR